MSIVIHLSLVILVAFAGPSVHKFLKPYAAQSVLMLCADNFGIQRSHELATLVLLVSSTIRC